MQPFCAKARPRRWSASLRALLPVARKPCVHAENARGATRSTAQPARRPTLLAATFYTAPAGVALRLCPALFRRVAAVGRKSPVLPFAINARLTSCCTCHLVISQIEESVSKSHCGFDLGSALDKRRPCGFGSTVETCQLGGGFGECPGVMAGGERFGPLGEPQDARDVRASAVPLHAGEHR